MQRRPREGEASASQVVVTCSSCHDEVFACDDCQEEFEEVGRVIRCNDSGQHYCWECGE